MNAEVLPMKTSAELALAEAFAAARSSIARAHNQWQRFIGAFGLLA